MLPDPKGVHFSVADEGSQNHWLLIYQHAVEDIRFFNDRQWKNTNYALLLYAAIVVISRYDSRLSGQPLEFALGIPKDIPVGGARTLNRLYHTATLSLITGLSLLPNALLTRRANGTRGTMRTCFARSGQTRC